MSIKQTLTSSYQGYLRTLISCADYVSRNLQRELPEYRHVTFIMTNTATRGNALWRRIKQREMCGTYTRQDTVQLENLQYFRLISEMYSFKVRW